MNKGTGYRPPAFPGKTYHKSIAGGGVVSVCQGNPAAADPWNGIQGVGNRGANPDLAAFQARYGFPLSELRGGYPNGPSNETADQGYLALEWFFENHPEEIGSTGRAGGWDGVATVCEATDLSAFASSSDVATGRGGWGLVNRWIAATSAPPVSPPPPAPPPVPPTPPSPPSPPSPPQPPPVEPPRLSQESRETLEAMVRWNGKTIGAGRLSRLVALRAEVLRLLP